MKNRLYFISFKSLVRIIVTAFVLLSCGSSQPSAPAYTDKEVKVVDIFYYDYAGHNFCSYLCYFGDNTGMARVFDTQNGQAQGYRDVWFHMSINDAMDGMMIMSVPEDELVAPYLPFRFDVSRTKGRASCILDNGQQIPVRVTEVPKTDTDEVIESVRIPKIISCPADSSPTDVER